VRDRADGAAVDAAGVDVRESVAALGELQGAPDEGRHLVTRHRLARTVGPVRVAARDADLGDGLDGFGVDGPVPVAEAAGGIGGRRRDASRGSDQQEGSEQGEQAKRMA
jgi:hypothetical protein